MGHALSYDVSEIFFRDNMSSDAYGLQASAVSERTETPRCPTENPGHDGLERCRGRSTTRRDTTRHASHETAHCEA